MRERRGQVLHSEPVAPGVAVLTIGCLEPEVVSFTAGQFVSLRVPSGGRRSYSIITSPGESDRFELLLKVTAPDGGTADLLASMTVGSEVSFFGPMGYFAFHDPGDLDVLFGATGVGISALLPMIDSALASAAKRVELFWGLRHARDFFLAERLEQAAADPRFSYQTFYSAAGDGYINAPLANRASQSDAHIYLCGHGQMIADIRELLAPEIVAGFLHVEAFYPAVKAT